MKSIILAAGFATRLYPTTENKAKPLLEIANKPIINHIIDKIREISSDEIYIITNGKFYNDFIEWKKNINDSKIKVINDNVLSPENRLGAIGDLLFLIDREELNDDLFVISGDNMFKYSLHEAKNLFETEKKDLSIFYDLKDMNKSKRFGVVLVKDNLIADFEEKPMNPKSTLCSTSTYFFRKETISLMRLFSEESQNKDQPGLFLQYLYKKTPIYAHVVDEKWLDIGTLEALQEARNSNWN